MAAIDNVVVCYYSGDPTSRRVWISNGIRKTDENVRILNGRPIDISTLKTSGFRMFPVLECLEFGL